MWCWAKSLLDVERTMQCELHALAIGWRHLCLAVAVMLKKTIDRFLGLLKWILIDDQRHCPISQHAARLCCKLVAHEDRHRLPRNLGQYLSDGFMGGPRIVDPDYIRMPANCFRKQAARQRYVVLSLDDVSDVYARILPLQESPQAADPLGMRLDPEV